MAFRPLCRHCRLCFPQRTGATLWPHSRGLAGVLRSSLVCTRDRMTLGPSMMLSAAQIIVWMAIFIDMLGLAAGTVQAADPKLRGATMGLHSMCGYAGAFLRPARRRPRARSLRE